MGQIRFTPDRERGGSGPGTLLIIREGTYDSAETEKGPTPGAQLVEIYGYDGKPKGDAFPYGLPLFPDHTENIDVAAGHSTLDFHIPKSERPAPRP